MIGRQAVVEAARGYIGTPYRHQGRLKGIALDCIGLVVCVARDLGLEPYDPLELGYQRLPRGEVLAEGLALHLQRVNDPQPGDIFLQRIVRYPQHVGIVSVRDHGRLCIIHAHSSIKRCTEQFADPVWHRTVLGFYQLPGVV